MLMSSSGKSARVSAPQFVIGTYRLRVPRWIEGWIDYLLSAHMFTDISRQIRSSRVTTPSGADMQAEPKGRLAAVSMRALGVDPVRRRVSGRLIGRLNG